MISLYRQQQVKAAVKVNKEVIQFYWTLGKDISEKDYENRYGSHFYEIVSSDLRSEMDNVKGLSESNIRYAKRFYSLYNNLLKNLQQPAEKSVLMNLQQPAEILDVLFSIPWTHHLYIIDKTKGDFAKAFFYVRKTLENNWSRNVLLNMLSSNLYEREGSAVSNFSKVLPEPESCLAQQMTKDPYNFSFLTLTDDYKESELKDALISNIAKTLMELGRGFAYMGKEIRIKIGETEKFLDMLFYCVPLHRYVVVEVKTGKFDSGNIGQLGTYVVAVNHQLNTDGDNPAIGLLICQEKDNVLAQYALESSNQPLGISEYELSKVYPENFKSSLPSIEDIENELNNK